MSKRFNSAVVRVKNSEGKFEGLPALRAPSGYELAVEAGFEGTEEEWLELMIGDGWIGAFQDLEKKTDDMQEVIDTLPETYATKKSVDDLSDITVPIVSNRPPTETDAGVPGKKWVVPYIVFKNLFSDEWTTTGAAATTADGVTTFTGDGTVANIEAESAALDNSTAAHIVYFRATVTAVTASNSINVSLLSASNAVVFEQTVSVPDAASVHEITGYFTANANIAKLKVTSVYNTAATQLDQSISISNIILVDLTADMCQTQAGLEFTEEETVAYFNGTGIFDNYVYDYSECSWIHHGINDDKSVWLNSLDEASAASSYLAFVGNVNEEQLDAAFGKNNITNIKGIGTALALYGWYKGDDVINTLYTNLKMCPSLYSLEKNTNALIEVSNSQNIIDLLLTSSFALERLQTNITEGTLLKAFKTELGIDGTYTTLSEFFMNNPQEIAGSKLCDFLTQIGCDAFLGMFNNVDVLVAFFSNAENENVATLISGSNNVTTAMYDSSNTENLKNALLDDAIDTDVVAVLNTLSIGSKLPVSRLAYINKTGGSLAGSKILSEGSYILTYQTSNNTKTSYNVRRDSTTGDILGNITQTAQIIKAKDVTAVYFTDSGSGSGSNGGNYYTSVYGL